MQRDLDLDKRPCSILGNRWLGSGGASRVYWIHNPFMQIFIFICLFFLCALADPGVPLVPKICFKIMQFSGKIKGKTPILSKF